MDQVTDKLDHIRGCTCSCCCKLQLETHAACMHQRRHQIQAAALPSRYGTKSAQKSFAVLSLQFKSYSGCSTCEEVDCQRLTTQMEHFASYTSFRSVLHGC